jgi:adenylate cyclase
MRKPSRRWLVVLGLCVLFTALALLLEGFVPLQEAELYTQDLRMRYGRKTPVDERLVLIGIDRPAYPASDFGEEALKSVPVLAELQEGFPWSRAVWAELINKLAGAGAKVIGFDLVFSAPNKGDGLLREALDKHKERVVIGCSMNPQKTDRGESLQLLGPNSAVLPWTKNDELVQDNRVGFVNFVPDFDGVVRRVNFRQTGEEAGFVVSPDVMLGALATRVLEKYSGRESMPAGSGAVRFRYGNSPGYGYKVHAVGDVLSPRGWQTTYQSGGFFRDKIVLVGPTAEIFQDKHNTPFSEPRHQMLGPELHLNVIAAALNGQFLRDMSRTESWALVCLAGLVAGVVSFVVRAPTRRLVALVLLVVGYWLLAQRLFNRPGWVLPLATPLLVLILSSITILAYDFVLERLERMRLRHTMGLYFSPRVLQAVLADPGSMTPRKAEVVLLLTDLRNSTPLAEALGPQGMFDLLNRVFEAQTTAVMSEEGNLEHFLGDQFLSYWGAPQPQPEGANQAERAAIKLISAMEDLRGKLAPEVQRLFGYGVALHSGKVLVGNKGSALRLDYGLVGDAVNEAARVEALTKYYGVRLLMTRDAFAQLSRQGARRLIDRVVVKGKSEPVELFECENPCVVKNYSELCRRYKGAYDEYFFGRFSEAQGQFEALAREFDDGPSRVLGARCVELMKNRPSEWKGIWRMEAK